MRQTPTPQSHLFINSQPLFIPGRREFTKGNGLFINRLPNDGETQVDSGRCARSVFFENQRHFGAGGDAVTSRFLVFGPDFMLLENRIAGLVDGKEIRIDGKALSVAHAFRLFQTNPHEVSSLGVQVWP